MSMQENETVTAVYLITIVASNLIIRNRAIISRIVVVLNRYSQYLERDPIGA